MPRCVAPQMSPNRLETPPLSKSTTKVGFFNIRRSVKFPGDENPELFSCDHVAENGSVVHEQSEVNGAAGRCGPTTPENQKVNLLCLLTVRPQQLERKSNKVLIRHTGLPKLFFLFGESNPLFLF